MELEHFFLENRERCALSFWNKRSMDIYFDLLVYVTHITMLSMKCKTKKKKFTVSSMVKICQTIPQRF